MTKFIFIVFGIATLLFLFSFTIHSDSIVLKDKESDIDSAEYKTGLKLFKRNCAVCHSVKKIDIVGPTLNGIEERHSKKWITNFILDKDFRKKDKAAIEIIKKYSNGEHPDYGTELTKKDISLILKFIKEKVASKNLTMSWTDK